ncbi:hypothetical protein HAL_41510 [Haladaptatus sp. T7]|nr:hypothetical protein HAL_41510 [Haladaptatus sp. T7]
MAPIRTENQGQSPENPAIYVFGVKHSDSTLADSIPDTLPEDGAAVYHECTREEMPSAREAFWTSPFGLQISVL